MSMRKQSFHFSLPGVIDEFLDGLVTEIGLNRSELVTEMIFYISMPENLEDFKNKFVLGDAGEDDDGEEGDDEDDEDGEEEEGLLERIFSPDEPEEEE